MSSSVVKNVAEFLALDHAKLLSDDRHRPLVDGRTVAAMVMRDLYKLSYPEIGKRLGGRDHSSIMNLIKKAGFVFARNPDALVCYRAEMAKPRVFERVSVSRTFAVDASRKPAAEHAAKPAKERPVPLKNFAPMARPLVMMERGGKFPIPFPHARIRRVQPSPQDEVIRSDGFCPFSIDEDGLTVEQRLLENSTVIGSWSLACAILRARAA